jgi:hypothetical protein
MYVWGCVAQVGTFSVPLGVPAAQFENAWCRLYTIWFISVEREEFYKFNFINVLEDTPFHLDV